MEILALILIGLAVWLLIARGQQRTPSSDAPLPSPADTSHKLDFNLELDDDPSIRAHFDRNGDIEAAKRAGRFDEALAVARTDIDHTAEFLNAWNRDLQDTAARLGQPRPDWQTVQLPAVEAICQLAVARRNTDLIRHAHAVISDINGLDSHTAELAQALDEADACQRLLDLLEEQPGVSAAGLGKQVDHNGHRVRSIVHWLERDGQVVKHKDGSTNRLYLPGAAPGTPPPPPADATVTAAGPTPPAVPIALPAARFAAIDVETATADPASICAFAITWVDDGQIVSTRHWLIRPPGNSYDTTNVAIHGIRPEHTADAPTFDALWDWLQPQLNSYPLLAHGTFDSSAITRALQATGRPNPQLDIACTVKASRRVWPQLADHKLPTVSAYVGHPVTDHHNPAADAEAAAHIAIAICAAAQITDLRQL